MPEELGNCPKCGARMKRKTKDFNPFMLFLPGASPLMKVVQCSKCGYKPEEWQGKPNEEESRWM